MKHIDILIHLLCLFSGILTAFLGFLLYIKYRLKVIRNYSVFILTTTFTVAATTLSNYMSYFTPVSPTPFSMSAAVLVFGILLSLINHSFSLFALGVLEKPVNFFNRFLIAIPGPIILASTVMLIYFKIVNRNNLMVPVTSLFTVAILINLFISFVVYSIKIFKNLKFIENEDLKKALKVFAVLFVVYIPLQVLVIVFIKKQLIIFLSRNLFYFTINLISIIFAARYFFMETPSIMDKLEISGVFLKKYDITKREVEIIELLLGGLSIKLIGAKLSRSFKTVNNHVYNIYRKTGVNSKMELLNLIKENKL